MVKMKWLLQLNYKLIGKLSTKVRKSNNICYIARRYNEENEENGARTSSILCLYIDKIETYSATQVNPNWSAYTEMDTKLTKASAAQENQKQPIENENVFDSAVCEYAAIMFQINEWMKISDMATHGFDVQICVHTKKIQMIIRQAIVEHKKNLAIRNEHSENAHGKEKKTLLWWKNRESSCPDMNEDKYWV